MTSARRAALSRPAAFRATAAIFVLFMAASSAPSPLYVVYQREWGFSATTLTFVFAVYVFALLATLLEVGGLSDHVGRRPVLGGAVALEAVALVLFLVAGGVPALTLARVVQGVATGAALATLGATLTDLDPPQARGRAGLVNGLAPQIGLAVGAVACGALVQYGPAPTRLVYALLLGGMVVAGLVVALMPESTARRSGAVASLRPRVGVPPRLRGDFYPLVPILLASWALGGLYFSLGPSVAATVFGLTNHLVGGVVIALVCGVGAVATFSLRGRPPERVLDGAAALLALGMALTWAGIESETVGLAAAGTVVAGLGFGGASLASFGTLSRIALPDERSSLFAVAFVLSYLAFSVPALVAGFVSTSAGLRPTVQVYALVVVAIGLAALAVQRRAAGRRRALAAAPEPDGALRRPAA